MANNTQSSLAIQYFLNNFPIDVMIGNAKPITKHQELALSYLSRMTEVFAVFDRLIRYETYFKEFLPSKDSGISESEAIEYHLRSYIEDFYILQERIRKITEHLTQDLSHYEIKNIEEVKSALNHLSKQIHIKLKEITSGLRRKHVHEMSISESDLAIGKALDLILSGQFPIPKDVQIDREAIMKRRDEVLNASKQKHFKQSEVNSINLIGMKEWFASRFIYLFSLLNGHHIDGLELK